MYMLSLFFFIFRTFGLSDFSDFPDFPDFPDLTLRVRKIMFIQGIPNSIQFFAYLLQVLVQAVLLYAFYRAVFDAALQAANLETQLPEIVGVAVVLQPVEIPLNIVYRVYYRTREIIIQHHLLQYVAGLEAFAVGFQVQFVTAKR